MRRLDVPVELLDDLADHAGHQGVAGGEVVEDAALAEPGLGGGGVEGQPGHAVAEDHLLGGVDDAALGVLAPGAEDGGRRRRPASSSNYTVWTVQFSRSPGIAEVPPAADAAQVGIEVGPGLQASWSDDRLASSWVAIPGLRPAVGPPVLAGAGRRRRRGRVGRRRPRPGLGHDAGYSV